MPLNSAMHPGAAPARPNILVLIADDLGDSDLGMEETAARKDVVET